jgi:hypothetical protein
MTLKSHGLFVGREYPTDQPSMGHQEVQPFEKRAGFPVGIFLSGRRLDQGVLNAEKALEVPVPSLGVWSESVVAQIASVHCVRQVGLEFHLDPGRRIQALQNVESQVLA